MTGLQRLDGVPRIDLGHWPTPLEELPGLTRWLGGPQIAIKRDDCTGLGLGGNKVRKLEYLMAEARADGHDMVITVGGVQSNHARQTAAAAARLGMRCALVLPRLVDRDTVAYEENGNVLLDRLLGADVHVVADGDAATERVLRLMEEARERGGSAAFFPAGGSTATGALGFVRAAAELKAQWDGGAVAADRIVLACSSGGTAAGLLAGLDALGVDVPVSLMAVYAPAQKTRETMTPLLEEVAARLGQSPFEPARLEIHDEVLGPGYGIPTEPMWEAVSAVARTDGILLDPVYTGKAMAGLIAKVRAGEIGRNERVLFWHTGGAPGLFAYRDAVGAALDAPLNSSTVLR